MVVCTVDKGSNAARLRVYLSVRAWIRISLRKFEVGGLEVVRTLHNFGGRNKREGERRRRKGRRKKTGFPLKESSFLVELLGLVRNRVQMYCVYM